jgi:FkbM family methyltransferase
MPNWARRLIRLKLHKASETTNEIARRAEQAVGTVVSIDGIQVRIDPDLAPAAVEAIVAGEHTVDERRLILRALERDDVVMELGGGVGMVSIACAQRIGSERVFSYEANPMLEPLIRENYRLNGVSPTMTMCMLGRTEGEATFHIARNFRSSSAHRPEVAWRSVQVPVKAFNDEVARIRPSFLVVDIEGGEFELLDYADLDTVRKLMLEIHQEVGGAGRMNALRRRVRRMGFTEQTDDGKHYLYLR